MTATRYENANDLICAVAKRAKELANMKMAQLRETNGYDCNTGWEAREKDKYKTRGEVIEEILIEEFSQEFPDSFTQD